MVYLPTFKDESWSNVGNYYINMQHMSNWHAEFVCSSNDIVFSSNGMMIYPLVI